MVAQGKKQTFDCPRKFGQWWVLGLATLMLGIFPVVGSASGLLEGQILHIDCNVNTDDQSDTKSPVENKGVIVGSDKLGHRGRACFFASASYLRVPKQFAPTLSSYTIASWVLVESYYDGTETRAIVSNYAGPGKQHYGINMGKEGLAGIFYTSTTGALGGAKDIGGTNLADNQWHHVAVVVESGVKATLYVDGVAKRQGSGVMPSITPTNDLFIGRGGITEGLEKKWVGSMDDIRILNRALSGDEIEQLLSIIDLPTGESFEPVEDKTSDAFIMTVEDRSVSPILVTPNSDGGHSLNIVADGNNVRDGERSEPSPTTTFIIKPSTDLEVTDQMILLDEAEPTVVARMNGFLDLEVTDTKVPDIKIILQRNSSRFAFVSTEDPAIVVRVNIDGTLDIVDENQKHISTIRHKDGSYTTVDDEANTVTLVEKNGDAVLRHHDYPNIVATFNVFTSQGEYTLVDINGAECLQINADGSIGSNIRGGTLNKVIGAVGKAIKNGVNSTIQTFSNSVTQNVVQKLTTGTAKSLAVVATNASAKFASWFRLLPFISKFAVGGIFTRVKQLIDSRTGERGSVRVFPTAAIVAGGAVIGVAAAILLFKFGKMAKEIKALRAEVQRLQAIVNMQAAQIKALEEKVAEQEKTIERLQGEIVALNEIVAAQAQQIDQQANRIADLENQIAAQEERIAKQEKLNADLLQRIAEMEASLDQANEGVDEIPDGEPVGTYSGARTGVREGQCKAIIGNVRQILGLELVTPINNCQFHAIHDEALNDSILFRYDMENSATVQIGQTCIGCDIEALAVHPVTGEIYVGSGDNATTQAKGHLYKLDAITGELRSIGHTGFGDVSGLAFDDEGSLWAWAKGEGLAILDVLTAKGELVQASPELFADITWDSNQQSLYGVVGTQLWSYTPATEIAEMLCDNLPEKTEAVRVLPPTVLPDGFVLLGAHLNGESKLQVFDIVNCREVANQAIFVGYDDVEGFDMPAAACQ